MAILLFFLGSCATTQTRIDEEKINELLSYHQQRLKSSEQEKVKYHNGIDFLKVSNPASPLTQRQISLKVKEATLTNILNTLNVDYVLQDIAVLEGKVSAEFTDVLLPTVVEEVLALRGLYSQLIDNTFVIGQQADSIGSDLLPVRRKYGLKNADTRTLKPTIDSMFAEKMETSAITYAVIDEENAVLLEGDLASVIAALQVIKIIDSNPGHLLIEALVIEFDNESIVTIGKRITEGASGNYSGIGLDWNSIAGNTITFANLAGAANEAAFNAAISLLIQNDEAQIIARPYISTTSGNAAKLEVASDRYVTASTSGADEITLEKVEGGVTLEMLPFLLPDNQVRIDVSVIASSFLPTTAGVSVVLERSEVKSTLRVGLGETFVIGGITIKRETVSRTGIPVLRSLPGVGVLFGNKEFNRSTRQLLVYITPHLWEPALQRPLLGTPLSSTSTETNR